MTIRDAGTDMRNELKVELNPAKYLACNLVELAGWSGVYSDDYTSNIYIEWRGVSNPDPDSKSWAIASYTGSMDDSGVFSTEPSPSNRTEEYLGRYRFTLSGAVTTLEKWLPFIVDSMLTRLTNHGSYTLEKARKDTELWK